MSFLRSAYSHWSRFPFVLHGRPNFHLPRSSVEGQWVQKQAVSEHSYGAAEVYWWRRFRDPVLNRLIEKAYANNLSLQIAGVRILQARAKLNAAIGNLFPQQQGASGGLSYYYYGGRGPGGLASGEVPSLTYSRRY
jgi:outer membrane protein TolC